MPAKKQPERVAMLTKDGRHPVSVRPERAEALLRRGYTLAPAAAQRGKRPTKPDPEPPEE